MTERTFDWTSAGVSPGIDTMLAFIASQDGAETAGSVQFDAGYYPDGALHASAHRGPQALDYAKALS